MLEDVTADLPPRDREAIVRRFYQRESFASIGLSLGTNAEAARKRVSRTLTQCRRFMSAEGTNAELRSLLGQDAVERHRGAAATRSDSKSIETIEGRTNTMVQQIEAIQFAVMTVVRHRDAVIAQGVAANPFFYDGALMNFTVTTPDGHTTGFFATYKPHDFEISADG